MSFLNGASILNTNEFLSTIGVGVFGRGGVDDIESYKDLGPQMLTISNVVGWIPGVSVIAGVASMFFGACAWHKSKSAAAALVIRGVFQFAQIGYILAPFDIGCSLVRLVRVYLKYKATHCAEA